jgi:hypothetical protein
MQMHLKIYQYNNIMYNSIIISSGLFGSVYLFSKSLYLINRLLLEEKEVPPVLFLINGSTFIMSGSIFIYSFTLVKWSNI